MSQGVKAAVVVDSTLSLPQELLEEAGLWVVPVEFTFDGTTYKDGDLAPSEFYRMLQAARRPPTTSAPRPAGFLETFHDASRHADGILCLTVASSLSACYDSARAAAELMREASPGTPVKVLDSQTSGGALGFIALEAARAATRGASMEEVVRRAESLIPRVRLVAYLDTLYYVWKGGRVSTLGFWVGNALDIKPILELAQGSVHRIALIRTHPRATRRLLAILKEASGGRPLHVNVLHTNVPDKAEALREQIADSVPCSELFVSEMTTAMGVHTGPGLLGMAFYADPAT